MPLDQYFSLGRTGLRVSRLALGTMTFGTEWGWGADRDGARALFDRYLEVGGNFLDTANGYTGGTSETWLGEFIAERKVRNRVVLATKFTFNTEAGNPNAGGNSRKNILLALEASLRRLQTDFIDLYIMHVWDQITPPEEVMRTLDDLVHQGKIRYIGLSDVPAWYASRAQAIAEFRGLEPVSSMQLEYSLAERNIEFEFTRMASDCGMGITVWSPLTSGLLSGKYRPSKEGKFGDGRLEVMRSSGNPTFNRFTERNWKIVAELESVANAMERSMAQVAINWVANRPAVASVILGATKLSQLDDNLKALDFALPPELAARLDEVSRPEVHFPYKFYTDAMQGMIHGGATVGDKPDGYRPRVRVSGPGAGIPRR